jgi:hypothetical protein
LSFYLVPRLVRRTSTAFNKYVPIHFIKGPVTAGRLFGMPEVSETRVNYMPLHRDRAPKVPSPILPFDNVAELEQWIRASA